MANQVILKKSSVAARVPVAGDLAYGELALNYADGILYFKKPDNTISSIRGTDVNALPLTGGTLTGLLSVTSGSGGGIAFPNNAFGGSGDYAKITLEAVTGEEQRLRISVGNDATDGFEILVPGYSNVWINNKIVFNEGNYNTYVPTLGGTGASGTWGISISGNAAGLSSVLAVASGGTGTATPSLVAGTNVTISGTWPNQTINSTASGGGGGTVTTLSVATANGFAGTVATSTSTPVITLSTSVTGLLKGNGTAISAATAGTDYIAPYSSQTANYVLAAPSGANGVPSFRALVASDIPTLNQNTTGSASRVVGSTSGGTATADIVTGTMGDSDFFRIRVGATASDVGWLEIATADNGNEPIYVRQYTTGAGIGFGQSSITTELTLLDASGNTTIPGNLTVSGNITVTGTSNTLVASKVNAFVTGTTTADLVTGVMGDNDVFRIRVGATATDGGWAEIATGDGGNEPIYVRQYTTSGPLRQFDNITRTLTLLDASGNTSIPGTLTISGASATINGNTIVHAGNLNSFSIGSAASATTAASIVATAPLDVTTEIVRVTMASNDDFRIAVGGGSNAGWVEFAVADDGTEPIYVRQYGYQFGSITRTLTLLDASGNTTLPGTLTVNTNKTISLGGNFTTSGAFATTLTATAATTVTLPTTGTLATLAGAESLSNKTLVTPALGTPASGNFSTGTFTWPTFNQNTTGSAGSVTNTLTIGSGLSGTSYNGSTAVTIALATSYGDTLNPYASKTANYVLAAPNGSAGSPTFRALVAQDLAAPTDNTYLKYTTAGGLQWTTVTATSSLIVKEEGTNLTTTATSINFSGQGVVATTSGNDVTVTVGNRVTTITDATSITVNSDTTDIASQLNTQTAGTLTINAPTGTPINSQKLIIKIRSTNIQTFSWNAIFTGSADQSLPSSTSGSSKYDYLGFMYNSDAAKWQLVAKNFGF